MCSAPACLAKWSVSDVHSHAARLHVRMQEAFCRLFIQLAILVYFSHKCISSPLRNDTNQFSENFPKSLFIQTTIERKSHTKRLPAAAKYATLDYSILTMASNPKSEKYRRPVGTTADRKVDPLKSVQSKGRRNVPKLSVLIHHNRTRNRTAVKKTKLTGRQPGAEFVESETKTSQEEEHLERPASSSSANQRRFKWSIVFPTRSPVARDMDRDNDEEDVLAMIKRVEYKAMKRHPTVNQEQYDVLLYPLIIGFIVLLAIMVFITVTYRNTHSLDFVRSASIDYQRSVDSDTTTRLTNLKAFLPIMASAKGIYGRGRLNELSDVFSRMGETAPHHIVETCFPTDFKAGKSESCTRIKLLTPEEVARDDL